MRCQELAERGCSSGARREYRSRDRSPAPLQYERPSLAPNDSFSEFGDFVRLKMLQHNDVRTALAGRSESNAITNSANPTNRALSRVFSCYLIVIVH